MLVEDGNGEVVTAFVLTEDLAHRFEALLALAQRQA